MIVDKTYESKLSNIYNFFKTVLVFVLFLSKKPF